jgi:predicted phage tail protein
VAENEDLRKRLGEAEIKINSLINDSSSNIRAVSAENEGLKRQLNEMKTAVAAYEAEVTKRMGIYELNIAKFAR